MKVIFLNTWHGELRSELAAYVQKHKHTTDVFCFQEAHDDDRLPYEEILASDFQRHTVSRQNGDSQNWYGNAIYVRKGISIIDRGGLFTDTIHDARYGLAAFVTIKIDDIEVSICNVHGQPYPGDKLDTADRIAQSKTILDTFVDTENVIIGGDFNLLPETESVQMFGKNGYQDLIRTYEIKTTRNRITFEKYPDDIQYFADYAFISPSIEVENFVVPSEIVSDHQPLELEVVVGERNAISQAELTTSVATSTI